MSKTKQIVLIANVQILETLSKNLTQHGYEILRELPMVTARVIDDVICLKPECIILSEGSQFDDGFTLLKVVQTIKSQYRTRILVHTQTRKRGDSLLSSLVSLNVYDFIPLSSFDFSELITLLKNPREYTDVADYHNYEKESVPTDVSVEIPLNTEQPPTPEKPLNIEQPMPQDIPSVNIITQIKEKVVGTITISVGNLQHGSGATHTALTIAKFLAESGFRVAVVELKQTNDYGLIYFPRKESYTQYSFKYKTFDIYANDGEKTPDDLLIAAMSKNYNYILLDAGLLFNYNLDSAKLDKPDTRIKKYEKGIFYNDFMKADIKIVTTFASTQFADSIEYLMNYFNVWAITDVKILFNFTNEEIIKSYRKILDTKIFLTPYNTTLSLTDDQKYFYNKLLSGILPLNNTVKRKVNIGKSIKSFIDFANLGIKEVSKAFGLLKKRKI